MTGGTIACSVIAITGCMFTCDKFYVQSLTTVRLQKRLLNNLWHSCDIEHNAIRTSLLMLGQRLSIMVYVCQNMQYYVVWPITKAPYSIRFRTITIHINVISLFVLSLFSMAVHNNGLTVATGQNSAVKDEKEVSARNCFNYHSTGLN